MFLFDRGRIPCQLVVACGTEEKGMLEDDEEKRTEFCVNHFWHNKVFCFLKFVYKFKKHFGSSFSLALLYPLLRLFYLHTCVYQPFFLSTSSLTHFHQLRRFWGVVVDVVAYITTMSIYGACLC